MKFSDCVIFIIVASIINFVPLIYLAPIISLDTAKILAVFSALWIFKRAWAESKFSHLNLKEKERLIDYLEERIEDLENQSEKYREYFFNVSMEIVCIKDPSYRDSEEFEFELNTHRQDKH